MAKERRLLDGVRVLLVEDAEDVCDILALLLGTDGAEVRAVRTARAAIECAAAWDFDVLLTDIGLPDLTGDRLIAEILGMKAVPPRIVAMTGFGPSHAALAERAGADIILMKPLEWSAVRECLAAPSAAVAA